MYHFHYSWDNEHFPNFKKHINEVFQLSCNVCNKSGQTQYKKDLDNIFSQLEDYYYALLKLGFVRNSNFQNVLDSFLNLLVIVYLDQEGSQKYNGFSYRGLLALNPEPGKYQGLSLDESKRLSIYHELGHQITSQNRDDLLFFQKQIFSSMKVTNEYGGLGYNLSFNDFCEGFAAIDEVVAENTAEAALCFHKKDSRASFYSCRNKILCPNRCFHSNFYEYMELQEIVYYFAKNLSFLHCSDEEDMNKVLDKLSKAMFSCNFCKKLWDEIYLNPDKLVPLTMQLICLGNIKKAKYACCEGDKDISQLNVTKYFELFYKIQDSYEKKGVKKRKKTFLND